MAEDDRVAAADALPGKRAGGLDVHLRHGGLQPGTHPEPDVGGCLSHHTRQEKAPSRTAAGPHNSPEQRKIKKKTMIHSTKKQKLTHAQLFPQPAKSMRSGCRKSSTAVPSRRN